METKICSKCGEEKTLYNFRKHSKQCKMCENQKQKIWYDSNKEKTKLKQKEYKENHKEEVKKYQKKYRKTNKKYSKDYVKINKDKINLQRKENYKNNKDKIKLHRKEHRKINKDKINLHRKEYINNRYKTDILFNLSRTIRSRISIAIRQLKEGKKCDKSMNLLGCSIDDYKLYIESKFTEGMTWDNHGFGEDKWHIDHILPVASFNLLLEEEQRKCFHYTNTQPMWQPDNLSKSDKILN